MTIYYLKTCSTCRRILNELPQNIHENTTFIDIKTQHISSQDLDELAQKMGSYEALVNKRAVKWKTQNLKAKTFSQVEFKQLILSDYTFLKRPVLIDNDLVLAGANDFKNNLERLKNL